MRFLEALALIFPLIIVPWVAIFGGVGAVLSRQAGGRRSIGFTLGLLLGPVGWIAATRIARGSHHTLPVDDAPTTWQGRYSQAL